MRLTNFMHNCSNQKIIISLVHTKATQLTATPAEFTYPVHNIIHLQQLNVQNIMSRHYNKLLFVKRSGIWKLHCYNIIGKANELYVIQDFNKCHPSHWFPAFAFNPLFKDIHIDLFGTVATLPLHATYPCPSAVLQKENCELVVFCTDLLWDVNSSLSALESDQPHHGGTITTCSG